MVSLVGLQCQLFPRLEVGLLQLLDFSSVDGFWNGRRVDTGSLDGDDGISTILEEVRSIEGYDTGLVWLGYVGKDGVDHGEQQPVLLRMTSVFDDGDDICSLLGHTNEIPS